MNIYNIQNSLTDMAKRFALIAGLNLLILSTAIFIFPLFFAYFLAALVLFAGLALVMYSFKLKRKNKMQQAQNHFYQETIYYNI